MIGLVTVLNERMRRFAADHVAEEPAKLFIGFIGTRGFRRTRRRIRRILGRRWHRTSAAAWRGGVLL